MEGPGKDHNRREGLTLRAMDPETRSLTGEVLISHERMQTVARRSMGHARECGVIVPAVLQNPTAVFEGLRWDDDEDRRGVGWRCYCGLPENAYLPDGSRRSPYPGQVYLVFVNDAGVAYNWRWERAEPSDETLPQNHEQRFRKRLL
jgi:hypothetical protein